MKKTKKIIVITSIVLVITTVIYFALGIVGTLIAGSIINKRYSDPDVLESDNFYRVQKVRSDYPSLEDRDVLTFECNDLTLTGYYYEATSPKGVIVFAHGINNLADGNSAQLHDYFLGCDYDVFAIDMTGCGRSEGEGIKSLHESKHCVINAVNFIKNYEKSRDLPLFLIGHSWGGYGVVAASYYLEDIKAVASFSAYNVPVDMMYGFVEINTSPILRFIKPTLNVSVSLFYGEESFFGAESAIKKNSDIPYIVIHGKDDKTVPFKEFSLIDNVNDDNYPNLTCFELDNISHGGPWKSKTANDLTSEAQEILSNMKKEYDEETYLIKREEYLSTLDLDLTSELNIELLSYIDEAFLKELR